MPDLTCWGYVMFEGFGKTRVFECLDFLLIFLVFLLQCPIQQNCICYLVFGVFI